MPESYPQEMRDRALELVAEGKSDREIGRMLGVADKTIGRWRHLAGYERDAAVPLTDLAKIEVWSGAMREMDKDEGAKQSARARASRERARRLGQELLTQMLEEDVETRGTVNAKPDYVRIKLVEASQRYTENLAHLDEPPPEAAEDHVEKVNKVLRGLTIPTFADDGEDA